MRAILTKNGNYLVWNRKGNDFILSMNHRLLRVAAPLEWENTLAKHEEFSAFADLEVEEELISLANTLILHESEWQRNIGADKEIIQTGYQYCVQLVEGGVRSFVWQTGQMSVSSERGSYVGFIPGHYKFIDLSLAS